VKQHIVNALGLPLALACLVCLAGLAACRAAPQDKAPAAGVVEITLAYTYGSIFGPIHEAIIEAFRKTHPEIRITVEAPYPDYEDLVQRTRLGMTHGAAPTLSFQGINQIRQFVDEGYAYDLTPFTRTDPRWASEHGYYRNMMALGQWGDRQYAIPFAVSTPIVYYNADLLRRTGVEADTLADTWPAIVDAARAVQRADPSVSGLFYDYLITGNWGFQALVYSEGGAMMSADERRVTFNDDAGKRAARLLRGFIDAGVMKDWSRRQGEQAFIAGKVAFYISSTSWLKSVEEKARFDLRTRLYPAGSTGIRALPTGGNAAVIITGDAAKARAAYEYAMFAAGPIGTAIVVRGSGYMPVHEAGAAALEPFYASHPNFRTSVAQIPYVFRWYAFPGAHQLKVIDTVRDALQAIVGRRMDPDAALDLAAEHVSAIVIEK
jgi:multiple sugar transport system substrate-binding protein